MTVYWKIKRAFLNVFQFVCLVARDLCWLVQLIAVGLGKNVRFIVQWEDIIWLMSPRRARGDLLLQSAADSARRSCTHCLCDCQSLTFTMSWEKFSSAFNFELCKCSGCRSTKSTSGWASSGNMNYCQRPLDLVLVCSACVWERACVSEWVSVCVCV